jgi:hypothetical protein
LNTSLTTTGVVPICVGSIEQFQEKATLNGLEWFIGGGSAQVNMTDSNGNSYTLAAIITPDGYSAITVPWTVVGSPSSGATPPNNNNLYGPWTWVRSWTLTDAQGRKQISRPIVFTVLQSPGVPIS